MKAMFVLIIIFGIWLAYYGHNPIGPLVYTAKPKYGKASMYGSVSTFSQGYGSNGNFPTSGNNSPGSGIPSTQPQITSTWNYGRNLGSYGSTGVNYK